MKPYNLKSGLKFLNDNYKIIVSLFFLIFLLIGLKIFNNYGLSWDEGPQRLIGYQNYNYIFEKNTEIFTSIGKYYGPAFEILLVALEKTFGPTDYRDIYLVRHLATFLLFYASVFFFYLLCKDRFGSWKIGLLGSLFLILSPRIFADAFYNSKDLAFLSVFIISIYTLIKYLDKKSFFWASVHAFVCAVLIDIRIPGVIVPVFTFGFFSLKFLKSYKSEKTKPIKAFFGLLCYVILLVSLTILFWPFLWENPFSNFLAAYKEMSHYPWGNTVLYMGKPIPADNLPWHYIPVWMIITTPLIYTIGFISGLIFLAYRFIKRSLLKMNDIIFLLWFFVPLLTVIVFKSVVYDGWRHLYFIYPAFLIISLTGLISFFDFIKSKFEGKKRKILSLIFIIIVILCALNISYFMIKNHPHQNVYFNILAGKDLRNNFELDYWGLSYRQALEYILKNDPRSDIKINAANFPGEFNIDILPSKDRVRLEYVENINDADYFLSEYRSHKQNYPYPNKFFSINIDGAEIMVVYKLKN